MKISDEMVISAILKHGSQNSAAKAIGVHRSTISKRLEREDFKEKLTAAKDEIYLNAIDDMKRSLSAAVTTLYRAMTNPDNPDTVKISAADALLRHCLRYTEGAELMKRVQRFEETEKHLRELENGGEYNEEP